MAQCTTNTLLDLGLKGQGKNSFKWRQVCTKSCPRDNVKVVMSENFDFASINSRLSQNNKYFSLLFVCVIHLLMS